MLGKDKEKIYVNHKDSSPELKEVKDWLEQVKFNKQFLGGLAEEDVWKKIEELNSIYQQALKAERIRYDVLLEEYKGNRKATNTKD